jgi:hypothetical protein
MKKTTLILLLSLVTLFGCKKESVSDTSIDASKNPQLISVSVNNSTSEIVRVR